MPNPSDRKPPSRKRQHAVPKFYLDRFSDGAGYVSAYDKIERRKHNRISTKNVAVKSDFYTLGRVAPKDVYFIEEALAKLETGASEAIRDVVRHRTVNFGDHRNRGSTKTILSFYMNSQILRSHRFREHVVDFGNEYYRGKGFKDLYEEGPPPWLRDQAKYYEALLPYLGGQIRFDDDPDQVLRVLFSIGKELTSRFVSDFRWILVNNRHSSNITTDFPIGCLSVDDIDGELWELGVDNIANIWLPLDPVYGLLLTKDPTAQSDFLFEDPKRLERWSEILKRRAHRWIVWKGGTAAEPLDL